MDIRTKEAVRYLGYGKHAVDEKMLKLIEDVFHELDQISDKRIVYRIFDLHMKDNECLYIEDLRINSKDLSNNLNGCSQIIMIAATLGIQIDLLMRKYSYTDMTRAVVMQACAAAMLEEYLDEFQNDCAGFTKPRFSPGYGDFSIEYQKEILNILDAPKKIGLSITDGSMLTPTKSVTAVIGISKEECEKEKNKCTKCSNLNCSYRNTKE